ncbi:MAG TPA: OmcA/MtrC family decaheme c-type cytochrome, partial [Gammaproteobacteria bacterium]
MGPRGSKIAHLAAVGLLGLLVVVGVAARVALAQEARLRVANDQSDQAISNFHGMQYLLRNSEFFASGRFLVDATITSATADARGHVTVDFNVTDREGEPVTGLTDMAFNIAKLVPAGEGETASHWVPYVYRLQTVTGSAAGDWPNPDGTEAWQGYREPASEGRLTERGDGRYRYRFGINLRDASAGDRRIDYERGLTHRVTVMLAVDGGATGDGWYDFVPDGSDVIETRDITETATCQTCHGRNEFHGHDGERHQVQTCATCHTADLIDPHSGASLDLKVLIHQIHAGAELATIPGADGIVFDNPATAADESADNGRFAVWGDGDEMHTWWNVEFPAVIENCTKCHQGGGSDVDNWMTVPSAAACGSCHNDIDFVAGVNHEVSLTDAECIDCHRPMGDADAVVDSHDWLHHDPRNIQEYDVELTVSTPANGTHFEAGEAPVVTIRLREDGALIDHRNIAADTDGNEGCLVTGCPESDGKFAHAYLFVHGPRAKRDPVLTTAARARVVAASEGPFDLGADGATLSLTIDGGMEVRSRFSTTEGRVEVPVTNGDWGDVHAATTGEIIAWLSADAAFDARAIAYREGNRLALRSRNLGDFFSIALNEGPVTDVV